MQTGCGIFKPHQRHPFSDLIILHHLLERLPVLAAVDIDPGKDHWAMMLACLMGEPVL
jgi:hypothetical protein